jgi:hypothetical protein
MIIAGCYPCLIGVSGPSLEHQQTDGGAIVLTKHADDGLRSGTRTVVRLSKVDAYFLVGVMVNGRHGEIHSISPAVCFPF